MGAEKGRKGSRRALPQEGHTFVMPGRSTSVRSTTLLAKMRRWIGLLEMACVGAEWDHRAREQGGTPSI